MWFNKKRGKFPTFAVIVLIAAVVWFISELGYLEIDIPWVPLILIVVALGWVFNRFN